MPQQSVLLLHPLPLFLLPLLLFLLLPVVVAECGRVQNPAYFRYARHSNYSAEAVFTSGSQPHFPGKQRIIGGTDAYLGQWPWQAFIRFTNRFDGQMMICGGSLISRQHILTAAHCGYYIDVPRSTVALGTIDSVTSANGVVYGIGRVEVHPSFQPDEDRDPSQSNDIAIITLNRAVSFSSTIQPICLPASSRGMDTGDAWVTGWGYYNNGNSIVRKPSEFLQGSRVPFVNQEKCRAVWEGLHDYGGGFELSDTQICAGSFGHGAAQGDSGGPLVVEQNGVWFQVGITSFGVNFGPLYIDQGTAPGIYTRVQSFCDFIHRASDNEATCTAATRSSIVFRILALLFTIDVLILQMYS